MTLPSTENSSAARFDDADVQTLKRLPRTLARAGYNDAYTIYGQFNLRTDDWARDLPLLPNHLQALFKLFLLGETVPREDLVDTFTDAELQALERLSLIIPQNGGVNASNLILIPVNGYLLFVQRPGVNPLAYFGDDSGALAAHLTPFAGDVCLDLCTGPGIQALLCSGRAQRVVGVDVNPLAAAHAELNVVMNDLEGRVEVRVGDLYRAVEGLRFDFVCANPPLLPFPPDLPYPFVGHGGADGLDVTRRILDGLSGVLKPGGLGQLIGTCLGDWDGPHCEGELRDYSRQYGWNMRMTVPSASALVPDSPMFRGLAWTCATAASLDFEEVAERLRIHLERLRATHLYLYFITLSDAVGEPTLTITRHYRERVGFWFI